MDAHICNMQFPYADFQIQSTVPKGQTLSSSAPELLASLQMTRRGVSEASCKISGPAADMWSAATVLNEMLTGHMPFDPTVSHGSMPAAKDADEALRVLVKLWDSAVSLSLLFCLLQNLLTLPML